MHLKCHIIEYIHTKIKYIFFTITVGTIVSIEMDSILFIFDKHCQLINFNFNIRLQMLYCSNN